MTPPTRLGSTLVSCTLLVWLVAGCASSPGEDDYGQPPDLGKATVNLGRSFAKAVGRGSKTAYQGMRSGFEEPQQDEDYGAYPKAYAPLVRKHFVRVMRYPETATFQLGRPQRGYLNQGILRGGGVAWRGWLVDVEVETRQALTGHRAARHYVVRMRDGEIVDVHSDDAMLRRVEDGNVPASAGFK